MTPTPSQSSWRTTLLGILALLASLGSIWAPAKYQPQIQATGTILAGAGLVAARDQKA